MTPLLPTRLVKVVVWDLDGTLWPGVALESDDLPTPYPGVVAALDTLAARGILVSVASRNPAEVGELVERSTLAGRFVAAQYGWGRKVDALRRIAAELDVRLDALAFVDDDPMERADVERALPEVTVLAPDEVADALSWPEFDPGPVTAAGRSRLDSYRQRERRRAARSAFAGSDEAFVRWCALRATVRRAEPGDTDRLVELARRTTQYNSTGVEFPRGGQAVVLSMSDRFGDDGLVGVAAVSTPDDVVSTGDDQEWTVDLVAVSCRAGGRGAVPVLLAAAGRLARSGGAGRLLVPCRLTERNVPVRLGLKQAGFTAAGRTGEVAVYGLDLTAAPAYPEWVTVTERL